MDAVHPIPSSTGGDNSFYFFFSFVPLFPDCQNKVARGPGVCRRQQHLSHHLSNLQIYTATPPPPPNGVFICADTIESSLAKVKVTGIYRYPALQAANEKERAALLLHFLDPNRGEPCLNGHIFICILLTAVILMGIV